MPLVLTRWATAPEFIEQPNAAGLPIAAVLTGGEPHDVKAYDDLMEERESDPGALLAAKGL